MVALRTVDRIVFGLVLPLIVLVAGMLFIANLPSGASAAEFAGLGTFFMLLFSLPLALLVNVILMLQDAETRSACFLRGMIVPGLVLVAGLVYQSGLWDRIT